MPTPSLLPLRLTLRLTSLLIVTWLLWSVIAALRECGVPRWAELHAAALRGDAACCRQLLERGGSGGDANHATPCGNSVLHDAVIGGDLEVVRLLLLHGARPDPADEVGQTPLVLAVHMRHVEIAQLLLGAGARPTHRDRDGRTPLHFAVLGGSVQAACLLLRGGADPNAHDQRGCTPLHFVALTRHFEVARLLLDAGADPAAPAADGSTALQRAQRSDNDEMADVLAGKTDVHSRQ
jgi:ankyrin repeat protein